jgi:hypothetical protein
MMTKSKKKVCHLLSLSLSLSLSQFLSLSLPPPSQSVVLLLVLKQQEERKSKRRGRPSKKKAESEGLTSTSTMSGQQKPKAPVADWGLGKSWKAANKLSLSKEVRNLLFFCFLCLYFLTDSLFLLPLLLFACSSSFLSFFSSI